MPLSIKDVARHAGVSSATVSRVLAGKPHVRAELCERVLKAVGELGYQPSRVAQSLRVRRSRILGLIISDIQNPFFTALARAVEDVAYSQDYAVFLCNADENPDKERLYIDLMRAERVAGVVISPTQETSRACQALLEAGVPVVVIDRRIAGLNIDTVVTDNTNAAHALVGHLIEDGHSRIAALLPPVSITTGRERFEGYKRALEQHGLTLDPSLVRSGHPVEASGYRLTRELLEHAPPALFSGSNLLTVGAIKAILERGLRIPEDIALVAFDEIDWTPLVTPGLTVAAQPTYDLGRVAATLLFERLADPARPTQEVILPATLHIRQSCARHHDTPNTPKEVTSAKTDKQPHPSSTLL